MDQVAQSVAKNCKECFPHSFQGWLCRRHSTLSKAKSMSMVVSDLDSACKDHVQVLHDDSHFFTQKPCGVGFSFSSPKRVGSKDCLMYGRRLVTKSSVCARRGRVVG